MEDLNDFEYIFITEKTVRDLIRIAEKTQATLLISLQQNFGRLPLFTLPIWTNHFTN